MTPRRMLGAVALSLGLVVLAGLGSRARLTSADRGASAPNGVTSQDGGVSNNDVTLLGSGEPAQPELPVPRAGRWILLAALGIVAVVCVKTGFPVPPDDSVPDHSERVVAPSTSSVGIAYEGAGALVVDAALKDALGVLREVADPRLAVRCAYSEVANGLASADLRRGTAESEAEFLRRALGKDRTDRAAGALLCLTELFCVARFSIDPVTEEMRSEAVAYLQTIRSSRS